MVGLEILQEVMKYNLAIKRTKDWGKLSPFLFQFAFCAILRITQICCARRKFMNSFSSNGYN